MTGNLNYSNLAENGNYANCLFYLDTNGRCAYVNEYCCRYMGYAREEFIARTLNELGVLTDFKSFKSMFNLCMHGKTRQFETIIRRKDGTTFPAEINISQASFGHRLLLRCDLYGTEG